MPTEQELSEKTIEAIREVVPKFKVVEKEKSWMHRFIGGILKLFGNPRYMDDYYTTIGYTIGLPKGMKFLHWETAWHEGGHGLQAKKVTRPLFGTFYLQGTPVWLLFAALFCWPFFVWLPWWSGVIVLALFTLMSFPPFGFWRAHWEFQMYGMSIAVQHWKDGSVGSAIIEKYAEEFTKSYYFWMCPFDGYVKKKLNSYLEDAKSGKIFERRAYGSYYAHAYKTMRRLGLVKLPPVKEPQ
jgi:hypothetical protein